MPRPRSSSALTALGRPAALLGWAALGLALGCADPKPAAPECGNGVLETAEECEGSPPPEGCGEACTVQAGWQCDAPPDAEGDTGGTNNTPWQSTCMRVGCGDGMLDEGEACDDANAAEADGCVTCEIEAGWQCAGEPSVCAECGDGMIAPELEACDNGAGPGCTATCQLVEGWSCTGQPSLCTPVCGDGIWLGEDVFGVTPALAEGCDDGNATAGDGCSPACEVEPGCECGAQPTQTSACSCPGDTTGDTGTDDTTGDSGTGDSGTDGGTGTGTGTGTDSGTGTGSGSDTGADTGTTGTTGN